MKPAHVTLALLTLQLFIFSCNTSVRQAQPGRVDTVIVIYKPQEDFKEKMETVNKEVPLRRSLDEAIDYADPTTRDFAVRLASLFPGEYNIGQVCQIYDYIVRRWSYVNDPNKQEVFCSASRTIENNLSGDCDDFAILMASLVASIGGTARISFAYDAEGEGHAFTETYVADNAEEYQQIVEGINQLYSTDQFGINATIDKYGHYWLNLDWFGEPRHPGGEYFNYIHRTIYYPGGDTPYIEEEDGETITP